MKPIRLQIKTKSQDYPIIIGKNISSKLMGIASNNYLKFDKCLLVVDKNIPKKIFIT